MNLLNSFIMLMLSGLLLSGCVSSNNHSIDTDVKEVSIIKITPFGQNFKLLVDIQNKGNQPIYLRTMDYELSLNSIQIGSGTKDIWRTIPAFSTRSFAIDVSANIWEQFKPIIATIKDTQKINYYFTGELITGNMIFQERVNIQQTDTLTANDLPLKKIQRLQQFIPGLSL